MRAIFMTILLMNLLACGKQENESGTFADYMTSMSIDSDFDGVYDFHENRVGTDPLIANIPQLNLQVNNTKGRGENFLVSFSNKEAMFEKELNSIHSQIGETLLHQQSLLLNGDFFFPKTLNFGCLSEEDMMATYGLDLTFRELSFDYFIDFSRDKFNYTITNLKTSLFDIDYALDSKDSKTEITHLNLSYQRKITRCLETELIDYRFSRAGVEMEYSDTVKDIKENLAHIFIKTPEKILKYSVVPQGSFLSQLKKNSLSFKLGRDSEILQIGDKRNEFALRENSLGYTQMEGDLKRWFFLSSKGDKPIDKLSAGEVYVLTYSSIEDVLSKRNQLSVQRLEQSGQTITLEGYSVGDKILIEIEPTLELVAAPNSKKMLAGDFNLRGAVRPLKHGVADACIFESKSRTDQNKIATLLSESTFVGALASGVVIDAFKKGSSHIFQHRVTSEDLVNGKVQIKISVQDAQAFTYKKELTWTDRGQISKWNYLTCNRTQYPERRKVVEEKFDINYHITLRAVRRF